VAIGEAAKEKKRGVVLLIDELQYLNQIELGALIMAMHMVQQLQLPVVLLGAGLPTLPAQAGDSKSYAERMFNFLEIGPLSETDAEQALRDPAIANNVEFQDEALKEVFRVTKGYPYFLQEWGYQAWNAAQQSPITKRDAEIASSAAISRLDLNFFRVRFDRLTPSEKKFLRAIAELGPGQHRMSEVAEVLGVDLKSVGPVRAKLLKKGMIYSPIHGEIDFTVPMFDEFMKRMIP